jgi:transposase
VNDAEIFAGVLGASRYTYAEASFTQTLPDLVGSHVQMFRFFGGVLRQSDSVCVKLASA